MKSLADDYKEHLDSMGGEPGDEEDGADGEDTEAGIEDACKMAISAFKKGDPKALAEAMCTMFPLLEKYDEEHGDGEEDGEPPSGGHAALLVLPHHGGG